MSPEPITSEPPPETGKEDVLRWLENASRESRRQWSSGVEAVLSDRGISMEVKSQLLLRIESLEIENFSAIVLDRYPYTPDRVVLGNLISVLKPFQRSPDRLPVLRKILADQSLFWAYKEELSRKVIGATLNDCEDLVPQDTLLQSSLYFGRSTFWSNWHTHPFVTAIHHRVEDPAWRDKSYGEVLAGLVRPAFDAVTKKNLEAGTLRRHFPEQLGENHERIESLSSRVISSTERESLERLGVDISANVLSLYMRYGQINYDLVADALLLCTVWFMQERYSAFFGGVRIIPRDPFLLPQSFLSTVAGAVVAPVRDADFRALVKLPTAYLSSSRFETETPAILSAVTSRRLKVNPNSPPFCVTSRIELEGGFSESEFVDRASFEEILEEYIANLIELDKRMSDFLATEGPHDFPVQRED